MKGGPNAGLAWTGRYEQSPVSVWPVQLGFDCYRTLAQGRTGLDTATIAGKAQCSALTGCWMAVTGLGMPASPVESV